MSSEINFDDEARDALYFGYILKFAQENELRYSQQAEQLLKEKALRIDFNGSKISYKLTLTGCAYSLLNPNSSQSSESWIRMGWGKAAKRRALPNYFARSEASVLLGD